MQTRTKKIIKVSRTKAVILLAIIIAVLGFIFFQDNRLPYDVLTTATKMNSESNVSLPSVSPTVDVYPGQYGAPSVKDTREFMKVSYGADIKTRDVKRAVRDVKSAINDANGRIDNSNETTTYAYISFVVPKSNFSDFKDAVESITNEKLIVESSSSQNLLGQKQSIEEQQQSAARSLAELQKGQKDLTAKHTQTVGSLQKQITDTQNQLAQVRAAIATTSDPNTLNNLRNQEYTLSQQEISLRQNLNSENATYATGNQNFKDQISNVNAQLANIKKQDVQFSDNIETVDGYISINWISLWDMAKIFSPIYPGIIIAVLVLLAWYYLARKNFLPTIELA
jgi:hypothetical protein